MDDDNAYPQNQPSVPPTPGPTESTRPVGDPYASQQDFSQPPAAIPPTPEQVPAAAVEPIAPVVPPAPQPQPADIDTDEQKFSTYEFPSHYQPPAGPSPLPAEPTTTPPPSEQVAPNPPPAAPAGYAPPVQPPATEPTPEVQTVAAPEPVQPPVGAPNPETQPAELPYAQSAPPAYEPIAPEPVSQTGRPSPIPQAVQEAPDNESLLSYSPSKPSGDAASPVAEPAKAKTYLDKLKSRLMKSSQNLSKDKLKSKLKPLASAALVGALIYGVFNSQLILGQIQYLITPDANAEAPAVIDPTQTAGDKPEIIIPKINLRVPVVYDVKSFAENAVQKGLERGVVHYGTTAIPGQLGNNVIVGHSSNNWWAGGKYKFAFVLLNKLEVGDNFYLHYESRRYTYEVTNKKIVAPDDVSVLNQNVQTPITTLITCDPPGTSWKRLIVQAKQIDPSPSQAENPATSLGSTDNKQPLPGYGQSLFEKIKDIFN